MLFDNIDIVESLDKFRENPEKPVREARYILSEEFLREQGILSNLENKNSPADYPDIDLIDPSRIYSIDDIRRVCIKYRLRFLDSKYFKGQFPYEAIREIKAAEKLTGKSLTELFIIAPSKRFVLEECEKDPLLLAHIGNDTYMLIHKWGRDLSWYRSLLFFPLRRLENLIITLVIIGASIAIFTPIDLLSRDPAAWDIPYLRVAWFFYCMIALSGITTLLLAAFHKSFSTTQWKDNLFTR